jgi:hypothetical protein
MVKLINKPASTNSKEYNRLFAKQGKIMTTRLALLGLEEVAALGCTLFYINNDSKFFN